MGHCLNKIQTNNPMKAQNHYDQEYIFPEETSPHEATWLQWPHAYTYGDQHQEKLEPIFIDLATALQSSEKVRIIVYDEEYRSHVEKLFHSLHNIEFFVYPTDDVWVRDNGPIFTFNKNTNQLVIQHWGFNGWGEKTKYSKCSKIPQKISKDLKIKRIDLRSEMVNQGGSVQIDGNGVMMGCRSSILNKNRNRGLSQKDAQQIFSAYYGTKKMIWLDGLTGQDITDCHIDGFLKFVNSKTILTFTREDLDYWGISKSDQQTIYTAKNIDGQSYEIVTIPLTKNDVKGKVQGRRKKNLGKGSYINFYVANKVVLVPKYEDPNDEVAIEIIGKFYPDRTVVGIKINDLFGDGGMIHCVTQQQPAKRI